MNIWEIILVVDNHQYQLSDGPYAADPSEFSDSFCEYAMHKKMKGKWEINANKDIEEESALELQNIEEWG